MTETKAQETEKTREQLVSAASVEIIIEFVKVNKGYGDFHVLKDIDLDVHKGERIVVCGLSGSGKSTLSAELTILRSIKAAASLSMA